MKPIKKMSSEPLCGAGVMVCAFVGLQTDATGVNS